jgi:AmmeMemoRadiSam system protein B/AmmeMemoRadiSam system protein A
MAGGVTVSIRPITGAVFLCAAALAIAAGASKDGTAMSQTVRNPAVAGQFYTNDPAALRAEITEYLETASVKPISGEVIALVSPHAGYMYSGQVAAYGYRLIRGKRYDIVVVISPSHAEYFPYASVFSGTAYRTPLGDIPVDREAAQLIASKSDLVRYDSAGHEVRPMQRSEHSLEVQLPFLQVALGDFPLVPIVMGDQSRATIEALGEALGEALAGRRALIVASTDLSHFHGDREARVLDGNFQKCLASFDAEALLTGLARKNAEACGGGPVVAAMIAAKAIGATRCEVLHYANSGDVTGDRESVVGYVSAAMIRETKSGGSGKGASAQKSAASGRNAGAPAAAPKKGEGVGPSGLTREDKVYLLNLARSVIARRLGERSAPLSAPASPILSENRGAFVTLHKGGALRGCIGYIEAIKPLATTIEEMAAAAAFSDWRFTPVTAPEVSQLEIEISVLSPISAVTDPSSIVIGKHGLIVTRGSNRGLLLPQVATEWGWDRETFLAQTCVKAGLPENSWREKGTKIESFSAEIFSEKQLGLR